jgi:hypothetical protein
MGVFYQRRRILKKTSGVSNDGRWWLLYTVVFIATFISYVWNGFVFKYFIREAGTFCFFIALLQVISCEINHNRKKSFRSLQVLILGILCLHLAGLLFLIIGYFDYNIIIDKLINKPLAADYTVQTINKVAFFALAGNEEAYTILVLFMLSLTVLRRIVVTILLVCGIVFFLFLGTRTAFFLYIFFLILWFLHLYPSPIIKWCILFTLILTCILFYDKFMNLMVSAFGFVQSGSDLFDISKFMEGDTLGFRIIFLWLPILNHLSSGWAFFTGLSVNGLNAFRTDLWDDYSALHNTFLYFWSALGITGLLLYSYGFIYMVFTVRKKKIYQAILKDRMLFYWFAVVAMLAYGLMNNAYSTQGMITYILVIAFGMNGSFLQGKNEAKKTIGY